MPVARDAVDHDEADVAFVGAEQLFVGVAGGAVEDEEVGALALLEGAEGLVPFEDLGGGPGGHGDDLAVGEDVPGRVACEPRDLEFAEQVLAAAR